MATIINSFIGSCIQKLQEVITEEAIMLLGVKGELIELQQRMDQIIFYLNDAEQRRLEDSAFNNWLYRLKDIMYDADDVIDIARFEGSKLLADHQTSSSKAAFRGCPNFSCISNIRLRHQIGHKIIRLNKRIENISKDKIFLTLDSMQPLSSVSESTTRNGSPLVEPNLVGNDVVHATRKIVHLVLAHKGKKAYKAIIVGTGGIGKTTLAQKIYNDQRIKEKFNKQAWVCVSKGYSEASLLREILRNMGVRHDKEESIGELQVRLESSIRDKSFFIVLDDVWQSHVWTNLLRTPLHAASTGIILITTRQDKVALEIGVDYTHRVELMSVHVGWELLWKSMNITEEKQVHNLRDIGIDIVKKCAGLPLAIVVIARVLAGKDQSKKGWKTILNSNYWSLNGIPNEISAALYLSYEDLTQPLKHCFLYCALYPEDSEIYLDDITKMWVAERFIDEQQGQLLEDTAEEYYYELISRNLLQPNYSWFVPYVCKMHDLLRQLAIYLTRDECFVGDTGSLGRNNAIRKLRCISVVKEKDKVVLPSMGKEKIKVRTFTNSSGKSLRVDNTLFMRFPCVRVLDLTKSLVQSSIPDCIGNLIHLRLLDLSDTAICGLPESIGSLKNLQILNLQRCYDLHILPMAITRLDNLRCLCLDETPINRVPKGIDKLKLLNDLEGFPIGGGNSDTKTQEGWNLEELGPLLNLRRLVVIKLERAVSSCTDSFLIDKKYLKLLNLLCALPIGPYLEMDIDNIEKIFEQLIPPDTVEDLVVEGFFGRKYPTWLGSTYLSSLKYLNIINSKSWVHLPPVGQLPSLKYLRIVGATTVNKIGPEFVGHRVGNSASSEVVAFPKLEWLIIENMPNWEEWSFVAKDAAAKQKGQSAFSRMQLLPRLQKLDLARCPNLKALPKELAHAANLQILQLRKVVRLKVVENLPFLSDHLLLTGCGQLERVSNIPNVAKLSVRRCPNLRRVDKLSSLQQISLGASMQKISSLWVPGLEQQHTQIHGEALDVLIW